MNGPLNNFKNRKCLACVAICYSCYDCGFSEIKSSSVAVSTTMYTTCKFFLENRCLHGNKCRYNHITDYDRLSEEQRFVYVRALLIEWRDSNMWKLSKFYPFENREALEQTRSVSFEEDRFYFYNRTNNDQYKTLVTPLKKMTSYINNLVNNENELKRIIMNLKVTSTASVNTNNVKSPDFGVSNKISISGQQQQQQQQQQQKSIYSWQSNLNSKSNNLSEKSQPKLAVALANNTEECKNLKNITDDKKTSKVYTEMNQLQQKDVDAFNSDSFKFRKLPIDPPPKELCIDL